jgi:hypothetical protein
VIIEDHSFQKHVNTFFLLCHWGAGGCSHLAVIV